MSTPSLPLHRIALSQRIGREEFVAVAIVVPDITPAPAIQTIYRPVSCKRPRSERQRTRCGTVQDRIEIPVADQKSEMAEGE